MRNWRQDVLEAQKMSNQPHYKLYRGLSAVGNTMSQSDENSTAENAQLKLSQFLNLHIVPGKYLIHFKDAPTGKQATEYVIEVPYGYDQVQQQQSAIGGMQHAPGMVSENKVAEMIEAARKGWERDRQLDEQTKKLNELTAEIGKLKKKADPMGEVVETLKPYLPLAAHVLGLRTGYNGPQVGIAGVGAEEVPAYTRHEQPPVTQAATLTPEEQAQHQLNRTHMGEVLTWLIQVKGSETEAVNFLYKLMEKGKANPEQIAMLEGFL